MHATQIRRGASDAKPKTGGRSSPPRVAPPRPTTHAPEEGCVISIIPFGKGVAYRVVDKVCHVVLDESTARSKDEAITRGRREIHRIYGPGEPVAVLTLEVL
ncbi:MAG: hypothetical protein ACO1SV_27530 [Fimbriimonas sp.]